MVYILEDDRSILELLRYALDSQQIKNQGFEDPIDFEAALEKEIPKILILDLMLPGRDGFAILSKLKSEPKTRDIIILVLSALSSEIDKVRALDLGAEDYITKPFGTLEFLARIRVLLRRFEAGSGEFSHEGLEFSTLEHSVRLDGADLKLTLKEFELLGLLLRNSNRALSRDGILEELWGYGYSGESRTLDMHIKTLRQKLGRWGKRIKTLHGMGYKLKIDKEESCN